MRAGGMRYIIEIQRPVYSTSDTGAESVEYVPTTTVHAERITASGARKEEIGEHFADSRVQFNVRSVFEIDENWRIRQVDGHLYTVVAIIPNIARQFNTLICERVNE